MQKHLEFQVVTPRTLAEFQGETLVLPDVRVLNADEKKWLTQYVGAGHTLLVTGEDATELGASNHVVGFPHCPGKAYMSALESDFEQAKPDSQNDFLKAIKNDETIHVTASKHVATSIARVDGNPHIFFANFGGLRGGINPVQTPEAGARVSLSAQPGGKAFFLPFLGEVQTLHAVEKNGLVSYDLPPIEKGGVFWYESRP